MSVDDDFLKTVEAMHAAALDAERWPDALLSLARLFDAVGASYEVFRKKPMELLDLRLAGLPSGAETAYLERYARVNPRAAYAFRNLSQEILCDYPILDERSMDRDPYYTGYLGPLGLRYFMSGQIVNDAETQGIVSIQRSPRQGHVDRSDVARMRRLLPHLRQAYDVSVRLRGFGGMRQSLEATLDWLADGVLLVRADGTVIHANEAAREIARAADGIRIAKDALVFLTVETRGRFDAAMGAALRLCRGDPHGAGGAEIAVPRPSGAPAYLVAVRPLLDGTGGMGTRANAIIFVRDPLKRRPTTASTLREVFGFTDAEADLARALQAGLPLAAYARRRMVSLNTVYTHLRRIKGKTGSRRMGELIRRLNEMQIPLREA